MKCINCNIEFEGRADAKFCSPKCRVTFSRKQSVVTDNVTFSEPIETDNFEFSVTYKPLKGNDTGVAKQRAGIRTAKYWYDVPLSAVPVIKNSWPAMPDYMNGRQYFLWWKNEFKENEHGAVLHNPFPVYDNITYVPIGPASSKWGV